MKPANISHIADCSEGVRGQCCRMCTTCASSDAPRYILLHTGYNSLHSCSTLLHVHCSLLHLVTLCDT